MNLVTRKRWTDERRNAHEEHEHAIRVCQLLYAQQLHADDGAQRRETGHTKRKRHTIGGKHPELGEKRRKRGG